MAGYILGIGNALVDIIARVEHEFLDQNNLRAGSMSLVDHRASQELYERLRGAREISGGSAANTIAIAASLGAPTAYIGKVAKDTLGNIFHHDLTAMGVATHLAIETTSDGTRTGNCLSLITPDGQRTMNTHLGVAQALRADDICAQIISDAGTIFLEGYLLDSAEGQAIFHKVLQHSKGKCALTLSDAGCVTRNLDFLHRHIAQFDLLFANAEELSALYEGTSLAARISAAGADISQIICTDGPHGVHTHEGGVHTHTPARKATVVDTTGAGDSLAGTILWALHAGFDLRSAAQMAVTVAAEVISEIGARPSRELRPLLAEMS